MNEDMFDLSKETLSRMNELWDRYELSPQKLSDEEHTFFMNNVVDYSANFTAQALNDLISNGVPKEDTRDVLRACLLNRIAGGQSFYNYARSQSILETLELDVEEEK